MRTLAASLLLIALGACTADAAPPWPPLGSPEQPFVVDVGRLEEARIGEPVRLDPTASPESPGRFYEEYLYPEIGDGILATGVESHHYPDMTVGGHYRATGTYVYYVAADDAFYLWGDDWMGHFDGVVGPFAGDPRLMLPDAEWTAP